MHVVPEQGMEIVHADTTWRAGLTYNLKGVLEPTPGNACLILSNHRAWAGIRFDEFRREISIRNPPKIEGMAPPSHELDEYSTLYVAQWLGKNENMKMRASELFAPIEAAGKQPGKFKSFTKSYLYLATEGQ